MNIGTVARLSGVAAKTIRYYESIGLIPSAARSDTGYRRYDERDVQTLRFIHRARSLGFSVDDTAKLLGLWRDTGRASADVKALARQHIHAIDKKIRELEAMRGALCDLIDRCHGDERPDCPILDELAAPKTIN
jgi:Cu(I)-responsive transcriptional regulator